jgi:hypothetical protein
MTVNFSDFPTIVILAFLALCVALPVKFAASVVGAQHSSLIRSFTSMMIPIVIVMGLSSVTAAAPMAYPVLLIASIMIVLGTGFLGAIGVSVVSMTLFYGVISNFMSGISLQ